MKRWIPRLSWAVILMSASALPAQEKTPALLVWTHSLDAFSSQSRTLLEHMGLDVTATQFAELAKAKFGPKGLVGIDGSRPLGAFLRFDPDPSGALVLPIDGEKEFFDLLNRLSIKANKENDGTYRLVFPLPIPVYAKIVGRHAWITVLNKDGFDAQIDPTQLFPQSRNLVSARVRLDLIPNDARQIAISQFEDRLQQTLKKNPPAVSPGQKAFTEAFNLAFARLFAQTLQEGKELSFDLAFEPNAKGLLVGLNLTPKSDTPLAKALIEAGTRSSVFANPPHASSALVARLNVALPVPIAKALAQIVEEGYLEGASSFRDASKLKQAKEMLDALKPSLEAGEIDGVFRLIGPSGAQKMGAVVGLKANGGDRLGGLFKSLAEEAKKQMSDADQAKVLLDADAVGAAKIHRLMLPANRGQLQGAQDILGESTLSLAFRPDAILAGIGWSSQAAVKSMAGGANLKTSPLAQIKLDVAQFARSLIATTPKLRDAARSIFAQNDDGVCQVDVTGGNQLSMSLEIRTPVLRFFGQTREEHTKDKK